MDDIANIIIDLFTKKGKERIAVAQLFQTLRMLEEKFASSPSFHVVGQAWSLADVYVFMLVSEFPNLSEYGFPRLQSFVDSFHSMMIWWQEFKNY